MRIGDKIKELRESQNLSYSDLIFALDKIGLRISRPTLISWENNDTTPKADQLFLVAKFFNVDMDNFFNLESNQTGQVNE